MQQGVIATHGVMDTAAELGLLRKAVIDLGIILPEQANEIEIEVLNDEEKDRFIAHHNLTCTCGSRDFSQVLCLKVCGSISDLQARAIGRVFEGMNLSRIESVKPN